MTKRLLSLLTCILLLASCVDEEQKPDTPSGSFEALWQIMDERYCFFDEKQVDWQQVHEKYAQRVNDTMLPQQLFEVMGDMLAELRDGHVNLYASFDVAREWSWKQDYPSNLSDTLLRRYMGTDYKIASSLQYTVLDDGLAYVRVPSFSSSIGAGNLSDMLASLLLCRGMILDLRGNGGGNLTDAEELAARFTNEELQVGFMRHKTGKGHNDFSAMEPQTLKPSKALRWQKPCVVLTNRSVYSAANECVKYLKCCPNVKVIGDRTGGGAGLPLSSHLPNGWTVRFSACPMYDVDGHCTEDGIDPDEFVSMTDADFMRGKDTIIERAREILR